MSDYNYPYKDAAFILENLVDFDALATASGLEEVNTELAMAVLEEANRFAVEVVAPLNVVGDRQGAALEADGVRETEGFAEAYRQYVDGGWAGLGFPEEYGGQGMPKVLFTATEEIWQSSNLGFSLCSLLTHGAVEALLTHGTDELKAAYLPKLVSGEWTGTMNLTEPQAGSDVGALRTKAEPNGDGTYAITGQKIYISWADNDFTQNVCHLVLARLPDGVAGTKGISLFMVPKFIPDAEGIPGERNSLRVVSLEHKMGLHGSPTAVMEYDGATGWMVGPENGGMAAMFTMMNNARLGVGTQGIGVAEAAYQHALAYAMDRKQGRAGGSGAIVEHADVRRMLATMKAETFAARAIALANAVAIDMAQATGDPAWGARAALLTPISKAFGTDVGCEVSAMGIQVHGGMGYSRELPVERYYRDARITEIYEGTSEIQRLVIARGEMGLR